MSSDRTEYGQRRPHGGRGPRQWDDYDDRRALKHDPYRDRGRSSRQKYTDDGRSNHWKSRSREFSESPQGRNAKESANRDRNRKSPTRRRLSPDWCVSERKRRFPEDNKEDYRRRREAEDKTYRRSQHTSSRPHPARGFKHTPTQEEDFKHRKTTEDSRSRHQQDDGAYRHQHDRCRQSTGCHGDRGGRGRSWGDSQDCLTKRQADPRERSDGHKDHRPTRTTPPTDGSAARSFDGDVAMETPAPASSAAEELKSSKGFQRFLDLLNKGVNVDTLTKIVTQGAGDVDPPAQPPRSPRHAEGQRDGPATAKKWREDERRYRASSPQQRRRSVSPKGQNSGGCFSSNSGSRSPSVAESVALTPEDEHKRRQMQDVLQVIGMDIGFEELGQMSHRIHERLYGKKDADVTRHNKGGGERAARPACSPRRQSRSSSSSRCSVNASSQEFSTERDSYGGQSGAAALLRVQLRECVEYERNNGTLQDGPNCDNPQSPAVFPAFSPAASHTPPGPPKTPAPPPYSPLNYSPLPYPPLSPNIPPSLPHVGPRVLLPHLPPVLPFLPVTPLNLPPAVQAPPRHILPPHHTHANQPLCFFLPNFRPIQPLNNTQKSKTLSRPRCLQVIETKQPG